MKRFNIFNIHGSVNCSSIPIQNSQQDAHVTEFIVSDSCSTCFGRHHHSSSGAKITVTTASDNRYTVIDRVKFLLLKSTYRLD
jgi:hypothetical protein